ncbi:hypothetical protein DFQ06_1135 [Algibacter lectus]|uniref:DUF5689 domain-containing protein n=2 Tax=Algibacter lectus TaxID=221126 RepID=A0A4R8MED9_9FLAO|nr:DUF5689 domain-containing protein [Algibacter lectus]TDY64230.1 hypothetical protein DFQ06_1135 [Algibacter lectus]
MKNFFLNPIIVISLIIATTFSCASNDDISIPDLDKDNPTDVEANTELLAITDLFTGNVIEFDQVQNGGELVTSGFIISSDVSSNINNQIYIQDKTEDATSGLVIDVELDNIFLTHGIGREVLIKLNGLGMKKVGNELHIGVYNDGAITPISGDDFQDFVIRTNTKETIVPKILTINEIIEAANSDEPLPTILVSIENVQIIDEQLNTTYANVDNNSDVDKTLINCTDEDTQTIILQNSGLSTFKALPFPTEQGTITAILSKNKLIIRDTNDIDFTEERCIDDSVLFSEDFESITDVGFNIDLTDWKNINNSFNIKWNSNQTDGNIFAEIKPGGPTDQYDAWLITKEITLNSVRTLKISVDINVNERDGDYLEVYIVKSVIDDTVTLGNRINTTNSIVPQLNTDGLTTFEASITIPSDQDNFRIGFRYRKQNGSATTEYQIDNIIISEE